MVYCWNCGEELGEKAKYCIQCGSSLISPDQSQKPEQIPTDKDEPISIENLIEQSLESHIRSLEDVFSLPEEMSPSAVQEDKFAFASEMYLLGRLKGEMSTILTVIASDRNELDSSDLEFHELYKTILEKVERRDEEIRALVRSGDEKEVRSA